MRQRLVKCLRGPRLWPALPRHLSDFVSPSDVAPLDAQGRWRWTLVLFLMPWWLQREKWLSPGAAVDQRAPRFSLCYYPSPYSHAAINSPALALPLLCLTPRPGRARWPRLGHTVCGYCHCPLMPSGHRLPSRLRHTPPPAAIDHHCCERLWRPPPFPLWPAPASAGGGHGCRPRPLWQGRYRPAAVVYPVARGSSRRPPHFMAPFSLTEVGCRHWPSRSVATDLVGGSANVLVRLLQSVSRAPPHGAPGQCAISGWRRTVDRLVLPRFRLHRPFRGKVNGKALRVAKSQRRGLLFRKFGMNPSIPRSGRFSIAAQESQSGFSDRDKGSAASWDRNIARIANPTGLCGAPDLVLQIFWLSADLAIHSALPYLTDRDADSNSARRRQVSMLLIG